MIKLKKIIYRIVCSDIAISFILTGMNMGLNKVDAYSGLKGDIDCDGVISISDVLKMRKYLLSQNDLNKDGILNADMDNNGEIDVLDMVLVTRALLDYDEKLASIDMPDPYKDEAKSKITNLINQKRIEYGLMPVTLDTKLSYAADIRAAELATVFELERPDGSSYHTLLNEYRLDTLSTCQYIFQDYSSGAEIVNIMMERKSFLDKSYSKVGIGFDGKYSRNCAIFFTS